jgi:membrane protease YdiL (CAAX protease family)
MLVEIFIIFIVPVLIFKWYKGNKKYWGLALFALVIIAVALDAWTRRLTFYQMGIRGDNIFQASLLYIPFVLISIVALWACSRLLHTKRIIPWKGYPLFIPVAIFLSIGQQFLYQSFLLQLLIPTYGIPVAIFITALLFGFLHILFPRPLFSFFLTFLGGLAFATLFTLQPNLLVASIAHLVLNITALQFSLTAFIDENGLLRRMA